MVHLKFVFLNIYIDIYIVFFPFKYDALQELVLIAREMLIGVVHWQYQFLVYITVTSSSVVMEISEHYLQQLCCMKLVVVLSNNKIVKP